MDNRISIFITGNPDSLGGYTEVGSYGSGLQKIDPQWPTGADCDYIISIKTTDEYNIYTLQYSERLITGNNRSGVLNFQLRMPINTILTATGNSVVSVFDVLRELADMYMSRHMQTYPGTKLYSFKLSDAKMSEQEIAGILSRYTVFDTRMPVRPMKGDEAKLLPISSANARELLKEHAYREFESCAQVNLAIDAPGSAQGTGSLEIPRRPIYDIYVNNRKMNYTVRPGDAPCKYTVSPTFPEYQEPYTLTVDFDAAFKAGLVDTQRERVNYSIEFKDKVQYITVDVRFTGDKASAKEKEFIVNQIYLSAGQRTRNGKVNGQVINFEIKGAAMMESWAPRVPDVDGFTLTKKEKKGDLWTVELTKIKKPEPAPVPIKKHADKSKEEKGVLHCDMVEVPVVVAGDFEYGKTVDLALQTDDEEIVFQYLGVKCLHPLPSDNPGSPTRHCFYGIINVPALLFQRTKNVMHLRRSTELEAEYSGRNKMKVYGASIITINEAWKEDFKKIETDEAKSDDCILVELVNLNPWERLKRVRSLKFILPLIAMLILFCAGAVTGARSPWLQKLVAPTDSVIQKGDGKDNDTIINPTDTITTPSASNDTTNVGNNAVDNLNVNGDGQTVAVNLQDPVEGSNSNQNNLQAQADAITNEIAAANLSFDRVNEILNWVSDNKKDSAPIKGYNDINRYITYLQSCIALLSNIENSTDPKTLVNSTQKFLNKRPEGVLIKYYDKMVKKLTVNRTVNETTLTEYADNPVNSFKDL